MEVVGDGGLEGDFDVFKVMFGDAPDEHGVVVYEGGGECVVEQGLAALMNLKQRYFE